MRIARAARSLRLRTAACSLPTTGTRHTCGRSTRPTPSSPTRRSAICEQRPRRPMHAGAPGYGFLSENAEFARRCAKNDLTFVGPAPEVLAVLGDKVRARELAQANDVPVLPATPPDTSLSAAGAFLAGLGDGAAVMVKAVAAAVGRHAGGAACRGPAGVRTVPLGGGAGLRQRRRVSRAAAHRGETRRGADRGRRIGRDQPGRVPRVLGPAAPPEAGRGGALLDAPDEAT